MSNFADRLKWLVEQKASGNASAFAKNSGISPGSMTNYLSGRLPQAEQLINIRKTYGININWLLSGEGQAFANDLDLREEATAQTKYLSAEEYILVPLLQSWVKAGPEGIFMDEAYEDYYPFKRYFIEKLVGTRPERQKQLFLARVKGDSMAPTINHGEMILFDTNEAERIHVQTGDIYLVLLPEGTVAVKRLSLNLGPQGARLVCHSDNLTAYKMFAFDLAPGKPIQSYVLGRVRWAGKEFD